MPMMPAVPAPVAARRVIAVGGVKVGAPYAAAPGAAHPAHLLDRRRLSGDLVRLRQPVRHGRRGTGGERQAAECGEADNNSFNRHGSSSFENPELRRDQLVAATSARGTRFNL